jgi:hypothetical protein
MPGRDQAYANPGVDLGMQQIQARMAGAVESPALASEAEGGAEAGGGLDVMAALAVTLGRLEKHLAAPGALSPRIPYEAAHPVPIPGKFLNAAGTIDEPAHLSPHGGYAWHIRRLTVVFGAGTTQVNVFRDVVDNSQLIVQFTASGIFEPAGEFLFDTQRLVYQAVGGGATINGWAIQVQKAWLSTYLM